MTISVAIAAYKGEKYIKEQILSILPQLGENDEIIISDDYPQGNTWGEIQKVVDNRIKYFEGPQLGVIKNFENALNNCSNDIVFLCDQDDVWADNKVNTVMNYFDNGADMILHDAEITDKDLNVISESYFKEHSSNINYFNNIIKNNFVGCCMAFKKDILKSVIPFPKNIPMHDWWIALIALKKGYKVVMIEKPLIKWRRHDDNVTGKSTTLGQKIKWRLSIIKNLVTV